MIHGEEDLEQLHLCGLLELLRLLRGYSHGSCLENICHVMFREEKRVHSAQRSPDVISHFEKWETYLLGDISSAPFQSRKNKPRHCSPQFLPI